MKKALKIALAIIFIITLIAIASACDKNTSPENCTVTFDSRGGSAVSSVTAKSGGGLDEPSEPVKDGFIFNGWYYDTECKNRVIFSNFKILRDITLYAGWIDNKTIPHRIILAEYTNGYLTAEKETALFGESIRVYASGEEGYRVKDGSFKANGEVIIDYTFIMQAEDVLITAEFELETFNISVIAPENGTIYPDVYSQNMGKTVKITAVASPGYYLSAIYANGNIVENGEFVMPASGVVLNAEFTQIDFNSLYNVIVADTAGGIVSVSDITAPRGKYVYIEAEPNDGYALLEIKVNGVTAPGSFMMPGEDVVVTAVFVPVSGAEFKLSTEIIGEGKVTTTKNTYRAGEYIIPVITPSAGHRLAELFINNVSVKPDSFIMPAADAVLKAVFVPDSIEIIINETLNGTITASASRAVKGSVVSVTAIPDKGCFLVAGSLKVNGETLENGYFIMGDSTAVITAVFLKYPEGTDRDWEIIISEEITNGIVSAEKNLAKHGAAVFVTVTPQDGYRLKTGSLTVNDIPLNDEFFYMPNGNVIIKAVFEKIYKITEFSGENGLLIPNVYEAAAGDRIYLEAYADNGYRFLGASYNDYVIPNALKTFIMPSADVVLKATFESIVVPGTFHPLAASHSINGQIYLPSTTFEAGKTVKVAFLPNDGYKFSLAYYYAEGGTERNYITDNFIMPNAAVTVFAEFTEDTTVKSLYEFYKLNREVYFFAGDEYSFYGDTVAVYKFMSNFNLGHLASYVNSALYYRGNFEIFAIEADSAGATELMQGMLFSVTPEEGAAIEIKRFDNIIVVSPRGEADADYALIANKAGADSDFVYAGMPDGSYTVLHYKGNSNYPAIPTTFLNRAISGVSTRAFKGKESFIKNIYLNGIRYISSYAFENLTLLTKLDLSFVDSIGLGAFKGAIGIKRFIADGVQGSYIAENGVLYSLNKDNRGRTLIAFPAASGASAYIILNDCNTVYPYAFYQARITSVRLPATLTVIGAYAFYGANGLTDANTDAVRYIEDYAFYGTNIADFHLNSLVQVGKYAFSVKPNGRLILQLTRDDIRGSQDFIETSGTATLLINVRSSNIDNFRMNSVLKNYLSYIRLSDYSGGVIYYESNGGSYVKTGIIKAGYSPTAPEPPVKAGHSFGGWYKDSNLTVVYGFNETIAGGQYITLYARWIPEQQSLE